MSQGLSFIHTEYTESSVLLNALEKIGKKLELKTDSSKKNNLIIYNSTETLDFEFLDKNIFIKTMDMSLKSHGTVFCVDIYPDGDKGKLLISLIKEFLTEYPAFLVVSEDTAPDGVWWYIYSKEDFDSFDPNEPFGYLSPPPINPAHTIKGK